LAKGKEISVMYAQIGGYINWAGVDNDEETLVLFDEECSNSDIEMEDFISC
jgi:hypothetical protein